MQIFVRWLPKRAVLAAIVALSAASPAHAQIGDVLGRARGAVDRMPSLSSFLEGEEPITTSLDNAMTEVAWLDGYDPGLLVSLEGMPMDATGRYRLIPGAYAFAAQSYCLKAGTHGPGGGEGYAYAPLVGPKAPIVHKILRGSAAHPEIPQRDIQVLLWAIIARTKPSDMPREMQATAARRLTREEIAQLEGGALGLVPEPVMRRAMAELPPLARQVFEAEARIRSMLSQANASYSEIERVAVLAGAPGADPEGRPVPEGRWSYHPDGYFIRFFPSGYSNTTIHVVVPATFTIVRDADGAVTGVSDPLGNRLEILRDPSGAPRSLTFVRPDALEPEVTWAAVPVTADPAGAETWGGLLGRVLGRSEPDVGALVDLARLRAALGSPQGVDPGAVVQATALVTEAWMYELCHGAGACLPGAPAGNGRTGGAGWRPAEGVNFDPSGNVGVPGNRARQRLGQSPRCSGDDPTEEGDDQGLGMDTPVGEGLVEGMQDAGVSNFGIEHIGIGEDHPGTYWRFSIRLDENGCPLPKHACIFEAINEGEVPEGSQVGAPTMMFGAVHIAGNRVRVSVRFVDVETGVVLGSARADAEGTDASAIASAAAAAFSQLGMTCSQAKGLYDQHTRVPASRPSG
jgi:hypothetical protein